MKYILILFLIFQLFSINIIAQDKQPLTLQEIKNYLTNYSQSKNNKFNTLSGITFFLINSIKERKIDFILDALIEKELKDLYHASDKLINTIGLISFEKATERIDTEINVIDKNTNHFTNIDLADIDRINKNVENYLYLQRFKPNSSIEFYHFLKGEIYYMKKNYSDAINSLTQALNQGYNAISVYNLLGDCYTEIYIQEKEKGNDKYAKENFKEAEKNYKKVTDNFLSVIDSYNKLGRLYLKAERYDDAILSYNKAIDNSKKPDSSLYYNLGNAYQEFADFYKNKGEINKFNDKYKNAIKNYKHAIANGYDKPEIYYNLGSALKELKIFDEAIQNFNLAIKLNPKYAKAYYNLFVIYKELGKTNEAEENYSQYLKYKD